MRGRSILGVLVAVLVWSCKSSSDSAALPPCQLGTSCGSFSAPGTDAGAAFDAGPGGVVTGTVEAVDATFQTTGDALAEPLTISGPSPAGGVVSAPSMGSSFELSGLHIGGAWFLVEDAAPVDAGAPAFLCTLALSSVAATSTSITLPLVPAEVMQSITEALAVTATNGSAQIAVLVTRDGAPSEGAVIAMPPAGATVAYDVPGASPTYATNATGTGARGVGLLLNVPADATTGNFSLMVGAAGENPATVEVPIQAGCVTIERYSL